MDASALAFISQGKNYRKRDLPSEQKPLPGKIKYSQAVLDA